MKIGVAQTRPVKGDIETNIANHKRLIDLAVSLGAGLVIFPELSITGYEPELADDLATTPDDRRFDDFQFLADTNRITIGIGVPLRTEAGITISMVLFQPSQARQVYSKKYIHADEESFFISGQSTTAFLGGEGIIALAICYELSVPEHAENAARCGADMYIASAVKAVSHMERANARLSEIAEKYGMTVLLSNCVGPSGGYDCGGKSAVWNNRGELLGQLDGAREGILILDTQNQEVIQQLV